MKKILAAIPLILASVMTMALNPSKEYEMTPKDVDLKFEEVTIPTKDGASLRGWYYPAISSKTSYKIVIISDDGDFYCLADHLAKKDKLLRIIVPNSKYLRFSENLVFLSLMPICLEKKLKLKKEKHSLGTKPFGSHLIATNGMLSNLPMIIKKKLRR